MKKLKLWLDSHQTLKKLLLKAETLMVKYGVPVCTAALCFCAFIMRSVYPYFHSREADMDLLVLTTEPKPTDYCEVCRKAITAPKRVLARKHSEALDRAAKREAYMLLYLGI